MLTIVSDQTICKTIELFGFLLSHWTSFGSTFNIDQYKEDMIDHHSFTHKPQKNSGLNKMQTQHLCNTEAHC